jgi:hypothetical protein
MIAAIVLAVLLQQPPAAPAPASTPVSPIATLAPPPVEEWPALPPYPLPRSANIADGVGFVRAEVEADRCQSSLPPAPGERLQLPVAILIGQAGQVRQIVPRAIGCPSVEQYVVGYLLSITRAASDSSVLAVPGWYQLTVAYHW